MAHDLSYLELFRLFAHVERLGEDAFDERMRQLHAAGRLTLFGRENASGVVEIPTAKSINFRFTRHCGGCMVRDYGRPPTALDVKTDLDLCDGRVMLTDPIIYTEVRGSIEEAGAILASPAQVIKAGGIACAEAFGMETAIAPLDDLVLEFLRAEMATNNGQMTQDLARKITPERFPQIKRADVRRIAKSLIGNDKRGPRGPRKNSAANSAGK